MTFPPVPASFVAYLCGDGVDLPATIRPIVASPDEPVGIAINFADRKRRYEIVLTMDDLAALIDVVPDLEDECGPDCMYCEAEGLEAAFQGWGFVRESVLRAHLQRHERLNAIGFSWTEIDGMCGGL